MKRAAKQRTTTRTPGRRQALRELRIVGPAPAPPALRRVAGRRLSLEGVDEIVLRCGKASITLRRNGKIIISGTFVESRASGIQRIKGAAVQIN
jgi:hypothetical protein